MSTSATLSDARPVIHPSAIVDSRARLAPGVEIGPGCVVRGEVSLAQGVRLIGGVYIEGPVEIGDGTLVYPGACIGFPPQDVKFKPGMPTAGVKIGANCLIREHVTIHSASKAPGEGAPTTIGDNVFMMANSHAGHDAKVGNGVILVNAVLLAGHSEVQERATLSGAAMVHQFGRIGKFAFISGGTAQAMDVPPFCIAGARNTIHGINAVGLRRAGFPREHITLLRQAFREAFRVALPRKEQVAVLRELGKTCPPVLDMAEFVEKSKRGIAAAASHAEEHDQDDVGA